MHELAITEGLVEAVTERLPGARVTCVRLEILQPPAMCRCRVCSQEFEPDGPIALCPCGSAEVTVLAGQDLKITSVQVA